MKKGFLCHNSWDSALHADMIISLKVRTVYWEIYYTNVVCDWQRVRKFQLESNKNDIYIKIDVMIIRK